MAASTNAPVCIKIPYKNVIISISFQRPYSTKQDATDSNIRVYSDDDTKDLTDLVFEGNTVYKEATMENLLKVLSRIDNLNI